MFAFRQLHQKREGPRRYQRRHRLPVALPVQFAHPGSRYRPAVFFDSRQLNHLNRRRVAWRCQQRFHTLVVMAGQRTQRLGADKAMGNLQRRGQALAEELQVNLAVAVINPPCSFRK